MSRPGGFTPQRVAAIASLLGNCARNLTQQALADLVGTGQKTVSRLESGHPGTKLDTMFGILAALDLDLSLSAPRSATALHSSR